MRRLLLFPLVGALLLVPVSCRGEEAEVLPPQPSTTASPEATGTPSALPTAPASATPQAAASSTPQPSVTPSPDFSPFAKDWGRHGFGMTVTVSGEATATWRVYKWCSDDPTPPCDDMTDSEITSGGRAAVVFDRVVGETAYGRVQGSTDEAALSGNVSLTLQPYDMASLESLDRPESEPIVLCGPNYWQEAPDWFKEQSPCGA